MYNIKAAVSRLEFAPKPKDMKVTDISTGHFVFAPVAGEEVSYEALDGAITGAGYAIERAWIRVTGSLINDRDLQVPETGQVFRLRGERQLAEIRQRGAGGSMTVSGVWRTEKGADLILLEESPAGE